MRQQEKNGDCYEELLESINALLSYTIANRKKIGNLTQKKKPILQAISIREYRWFQIFQFFGIFDNDFLEEHQSGPSSNDHIRGI